MFDISLKSSQQFEVARRVPQSEIILLLIASICTEFSARACLSGNAFSQIDRCCNEVNDESEGR